MVGGDPGMGKTALLAEVTSDLSGARVMWTDGFEAESTMPYSALHLLGVSLAPYAGALPTRQQEALRVAAGVVDGVPPDPFLVGLGMLGLLDLAGRDEPIVCVFDDAHWLDPESLGVLAFVARRLRAESVALYIALRDDPPLDGVFAGVASLRIGGLDRQSAVSLLSASVRKPIDPLAAAEVADATGGNPLALIDLALDLTTKELTDSSLRDEPIPIGRHLEAHYVRRVRQTPLPVQQWLLVAAADSTGNLDLIRRTAKGMGLDDHVADVAEEAGLVSLAETVRFRHPLVQAAVYNAAHGPERRRAHQALAASCSDLGLTDLAVWHSARAVLGTDPEVADRLDQVADRAGARGGMASRARVLSRAAELTAPGKARNERLISAAEAALAAGAAQVAITLLDEVDHDALDPVHRGRMSTVSAAVSLFTGDPAGITRASARMLDAAALFHGKDAQLEQRALIRAFDYCLPAERLLTGTTLHDLGLRLGAGASVLDSFESTLLEALGAHIHLPYEEAVPVMRRAVQRLVGADVEADLTQVGPVSVALTTALWDLDARAACLERVADIARQTGSLLLLDTVLWIQSLVELSGGTPRRAGEAIEQVRELRRAIGYDTEHVVNVAYLAWVGTPRDQVEAHIVALQAAGWGGVHSSAVAALAVRDLAEGHYRDAYDRLKPLVEDPFLQTTPLQYPDFVEAAVRAGNPSAAAPFAATLTAMADASGSPWARGLAARSRALLAPDDEAELEYGYAVEQLKECGAVVDQARAHLLHGEWLRRLKRRRDAREQLQQAVEIFDRAGAPFFAARARAELAATGARPETSVTSGPDLTVQEASVARLAATGHTNAEIGSALFLSANTVDYHLRKVFQKLGISSRRQLREHSDDLG